MGILMNELLVIIVILLIYISIQLTLNGEIRKNMKNNSSKTNSKNIYSSKFNKGISNSYDETHINELSSHFINDKKLPVVNVFSHEVSKTPMVKSVVPINIPTRGSPGSFCQIGVLTNNDNTNILPLFGRQTWCGSGKWNYYTQTDKFVSVRLPVYKNGRDCSAEYGCDELYDGDDVNVPQLNENFKVTIYNTDGPRYIPFV